MNNLLTSFFLITALLVGRAAVGQFYGSIDENHEGYYTQGGALCDPNPNPPNGIIQPPDNHIVSDDTDLTNCQALSKLAHSYESEKEYQKAYDAYRNYIETCAYLPNSYNSFSGVASMNSVRSQEKKRFEELREWLKKVLYYNVDSNYYCADVGQLFATFDWFNDQRGNDIKGMLGLSMYIIDSSHCEGLKQYCKNHLQETWTYCYSTWADSIPDPDMYTFDSTLPTLDDLGLGILRGNSADVKRFNDAVIGPLVSNVYSMPNPFTSETKISFTCRESAALKFEVFDVLGKKVYDGGSRVFDKGENRIILPVAGIPEGLLYGRFLLPDGSARTIKLRKLE